MEQDDEHFTLLAITDSLQDMTIIELAYYELQIVMVFKQGAPVIIFFKTPAFPDVVAK